MLKQNYAKKILVLSTHPDDETLGAGGTLLKHKAQGNEIYCVFCTEICEDEGFLPAQIAKRDEEIKQVAQAYHFDGIYHLGLKTTKLDSYSRSEIISKISKIFQEVQPNIVYLPFAYDVHSDHRIIFECAYSCTKSFRYPSIERILMMETLSETDFSPSLPHQSFVPNVFVDITPYIEEKCKIMQIYSSELALPPFPRSLENIQALALYRGSTMGSFNDSRGGGINYEGTKYAESFMLLKERW